MEKKYQVFISSTYKDLKAARKHVSDAILSMGHFPVGMEMFGASDDKQWEIIKRTINQSDYYIVIIGRCFGSEVPGEEISYTQKEFRYAKDKGLPILAFIATDDASIAPSNQDTDQDKIAKLNKFKKELETGRTVDYWKNYDNLALKVILSLQKETYSHPRPGWVRAEEMQKSKRTKDNAEAEILNNIKDGIVIKQKLMDSLLDYSWVKTDNGRRIIARNPWMKFKESSLVLRDYTIKNPSYENGMIKVEPYDFYDDGILVFSARGGAVVTVKAQVGEEIRKTIVDTYIVNAIPFSRIRVFNERGDRNNPYPTLYCRFENGHPFEGKWYIDKQTGIRYKDEQIDDIEINHK